jgi:CheY-like chemotaxis protein
MGTAFNILLVDDDLIDQQSIVRALSRAGIDNNLVIAGDGDEGLAMLRGENGHTALPKPHLILLDLNMPRMSGLEFLDHLRRDSHLSASVVFVLSSSADANDIEQSYARQVAGYISKSTLSKDMSLLSQFLEVYGQLVALPA